MCQQKIDKMKMCHVQWETSSIQSILKPLQKGIKSKSYNYHFIT